MERTKRGASRCFFGLVWCRRLVAADGGFSLSRAGAVPRLGVSAVATRRRLGVPSGVRALRTMGAALLVPLLATRGHKDNEPVCHSPPDDKCMSPGGQLRARLRSGVHRAVFRAAARELFAHHPR
ncbi:hypothetical protein MRX96_037003 [Rhipicephalus microplus]